MKERKSEREREREFKFHCDLFPKIKIFDERILCLLIKLENSFVKGEGCKNGCCLNHTNNISEKGGILSGGIICELLEAKLRSIVNIFIAREIAEDSSSNFQNNGRRNCLRAHTHKIHPGPIQ